MIYEQYGIIQKQITDKLQINCKFDKLDIKPLQPCPKQPHPKTLPKHYEENITTNRISFYKRFLF